MNLRNTLAEWQPKSPDFVLCALYRRSRPNSGEFGYIEVSCHSAKVLRIYAFRVKEPCFDCTMAYLPT